MTFFLQALTAAAKGKSKTININVLLTAALVWYCQTRQVPLTPEQAAMLVGIAYGAVNLVLRFVTGKSLPEKGITVPRPQALDDLVAVAEAHPEAAERLAESLLPAIKAVIKRNRAEAS